MTSASEHLDTSHGERAIGDQPSPSAAGAAIDVTTADFFTDTALVSDPYEYFDTLRALCPVHPVPHPRVVAVTGYEEAVAVYKDAATYSSCNSVGGPWPTLDVPEGQDDIAGSIEAHRGEWPMSEFMVTMDGPDHEAQRGLLRRLLTPRRLKENAAALAGIADSCVDAFRETGKCEFFGDYGKPFTTLAIADLLGVPEEDRDEIRQVLVGTSIGVVGEEQTLAANPLEFLYAKFGDYVLDRRRNPRPDVLTELASATYEDGTLPEIDAIVRTATFLFGAGQDTSARMLCSAMRYLAEDKDIQARLRADNTLIPDFIEEVLRLESPAMSDFRLARVSTELGGVDVAAGTTIMIHPGAANRDERHFERPNECVLGRGNVREHIAFGRGAHSCPGGPLARAEGRVTIERFLARTADISLSEEEHGPAGQHRFAYDPTFIVRGLSHLHLTFTPAD